MNRYNKETNREGRNINKTEDMLLNKIKQEDLIYEMAEEVDMYDVDNIVDDYSHTISKGNENQDIRFNKNKNRKEINKVTRKNQLR